MKSLDYFPWHTGELTHELKNCLKQKINTLGSACECLKINLKKIYIRHNSGFPSGREKIKTEPFPGKKNTQVLLETVAFLSGVSMQYFSPDQYDSNWRISFY